MPLGGEKYLKRPTLHIVAIGASAGGLDALQHLLSHLPPLKNACLIVAQHLSPSHKSILTHLLNRETDMTVEVATSNKPLKAGVIYVTPPDREITVENGKIVLHKAPVDAGPKPSVDVLFNSLAYLNGHRIVGVILSGTGNDGAHGVAELHKAGGYIIVQSPETAKFDGMPRAAIQTGIVNEIVPVDRIGASIRDHLNGKPHEPFAEPSDEISDSMSRIFFLLGKRTGADFSNYKPATISRRLEKRMSQLGMSNLDEYVALIERDPKEADEMFNTILIGVTTFFRDPTAFSDLADALTLLIKEKSDPEPIRVWVPGCSTGQEAYSIAILLAQLLKTHKSTFSYQIFATDIDDRAISIARKGMYSISELDAIPDIYQQDAISLLGDQFEISTTIRARVLFSRHDLLQHPPFLKLDVISCRNLLIYFNSVLQQRLFPVFHYALKPDGILFLGKSESIGEFSDLFGTILAKNRLYRRKRGGSLHARKYPTKISLPKGNPKPTAVLHPPKKLTLREMVRETLFNTYEHPYVVVNERFDVVEVNGDVRLFLSLAPGEIQANLLRMVHPDIQMDVRSVLTQAIKERTSVKGRIRRFEPFGLSHHIRIHAKPLMYSLGSEEFFIVLFELMDLKDVLSASSEPGDSDRLHELEQELASTKLQLQTYIDVIETSNEELQSLNEELQSTNEEFQSSNEELETSNEELQSANEEIQITYAELKAANMELESREKALMVSQANSQALLSNDLQAFVLADSTYKIHQFNHKALETFRQLSGRTISDGDSIIDLIPEGQVELFMRHFKKALKGKPSTIELELTDVQDQQRWFALHFSPATDREGAVHNVSIGALDVTDLKITLSELNSRERLVNAVFNATSNGICITDENGFFVDMNDNYCKIYGYAKEELIGTHFTRMVAPKHEPFMRKAHDDFILNGIEPPGEFDVVDKEGRPLTIKVSAELLIDPDGKRFKVTTIENITEFKRSQAELFKSQVKINQSEAIMAEAQRFAKMGSWNFDFRTDSLTWTDALYDVFGADRETFNETHKSFLDLIHPDDRDFAEQTSKKTQETGEPFNITYRITTPTGEHRIIEEFGYTEMDESGRVVRLFGTAQNVTDRNRAEQRYRSLVENGGDAIAIIGADGRPTYVSPSITNVLGYSEKEALDLNLFTIIHPDDAEGVMEKMNLALANPGVPTKGHTSRTKHKDGSWRWLEATITNLLDDPNIQGIVDNFRDVTDSVLTSQLEQLERVMMEDSIKEGADLDAILSVYLRGIESIFPDMHCTLMTVVDGHVYTRIAPSLEPELWRSFDGKPIGPKHGSCGTAAYTGKRVIVTDIAKDPLWKAYRNDALAHGIRASWSQPIFDSKGQVLATFANYYSIAKTPTEKELELFMRSASLLGVIMESHNRLQAMVESNERFEYATQATSDAIYDWDVIQDQFTWGDGYYRLFGYPKTGNPYRLADWIAMTHTDDVVTHADRWNAFINDPHQNKWDNSFRFLRHDGRYAYVEESGHLIRNSEGKPVRMIGVIRDETTEKLKEIQQSVQRELAELFKNNTHLDITLTNVLEYLTVFGGFETAEIWLKNYDGSVLNLMSTFSASEEGNIFYKESTSFQQFKLGEGLPGAVWKNPKRHIWHQIDTKKEFLRHDAAKIAGLKSALAIPLFHNEVVIGVMMFGSTKELQENDLRFDALIPLKPFLGAEIKRKQQEIELHNFFNSSPDILAIASPKGHFVKVNPAFCTLMGYSEEELTTLPFETFMHPDDRIATLKEFDETISGERHAKGFINRYITKSGVVVWISWSSSDVYGEDGFMFAYGRNISDIITLQELFDNAAKLAKIGSWEVDFDKNTVYWSDITRVIHEMDADFVPDLEKGLEFYRDDVRHIITQSIEKAIQSNESFDLELPIVTGKGNERWIRTIGQPEFRDGKCVRIYGSFQDIQQRKTAELALQSTLLEKTNILESIGDGFFTLDRNFTVTYWNGVAETYLKTPRQAIIGKHLWDVFKDATDLPSYRNYNKAMMENEIVHFDDYYEGVDRWFEVNAYPSESGLSVFFKDITNRKRSEELIRQSTERFQIVTEATNDAIWDFDVTKNELFWGKGFLTQFGYDPELEKPNFNRLMSLIHPEDRERISVNVEAYFRNTAAKVWFEEYRFLKADGAYATVIDRAVFIRNAEGQVVRVVGAMTDISYRKTYEDSLKQLNRKLEQHAKELELSNAELEQFAYVASHDLQEPLRMITSFLTQLERKYSDKLDAKAHQYIHFAVDGASRMRGIILDLLEFSRVGRLSTEKETFQLKDLIDEYQLLRAKLIQEKSALVICGTLPVLNTYRSQVAQVMNNLLDNAIKYAKTGVKPEIRIQSKKKGAFWEISVIDNGIGISEEYYDKIFIIFQRLHDKTEFSGSGIGLAIVKKIMDNLGGTIWVTSVEGKGSTFTFTVPIE